ncbi:MAG: hypothetical protein ACR2JB_13010 [Bryobacteraceae bacterium]
MKTDAICSITTDGSEGFAQTICPDSTVTLPDPEDVMLAALHVQEEWQPDRLAEARMTLMEAE